ncbi:MAG: hypothetical protein KKD73_09250 [Proteobacteria bacterium]|nr:hypothetical protein [Pseudomonadota bacterium]MBU1641633.1 hypothetical protein [Pseudomonadota bacterium]
MDKPFDNLLLGGGGGACCLAVKVTKRSPGEGGRKGKKKKGGLECVGIKGETAGDYEVMAGDQKVTSHDVY